MSRGYATFTHATVTDAIGGDPTTGTLWNDSYEAAQDALINAILTDIDADVSYCFAQLGADVPDNVSHQYKDTATVTVAAGIAGGWEIANATDVDFTGAAATTRYYLWVGENSVSGQTDIKKGTSATIAPAGLVSDTAYKLRWYVDTNGSSQVSPYWFPFGDDVDNVTYSYTDADTITFTPGTKFTDHTGALHRLEASTTLKLSTGRTADIGAEAANTLYYIWGGAKASDGTLGFYFHTSATTKPSEFSRGRLLRGAVRNDNSSNIMPFHVVNNNYFYDVDAVCNGSDVTEVLDATVSTTFVDVNCSAFLPAGKRTVFCSVYSGSGATYYNLYARVNGAVSTNGRIIGTVINGTPLLSLAFFTNTDATGIFEIYSSASQTLRVSCTGYPL